MTEKEQEVEDILFMDLGQVKHFKTELEQLRVTKIPGGWIYSTQNNGSVFVKETQDQLNLRTIRKYSKGEIVYGKTR